MESKPALPSFHQGTTFFFIPYYGNNDNPCYNDTLRKERELSLFPSSTVLTSKSLSIWNMKKTRWFAPTSYHLLFTTVDTRAHWHSSLKSVGDAKDNSRTISATIPIGSCKASWVVLCSTRLECSLSDC